MIGSNHLTNACACLLPAAPIQFLLKIDQSSPAATRVALPDSFLDVERQAGRAVIMEWAAQTQFAAVADTLSENRDSRYLRILSAPSFMRASILELP